MSLTDLVSPRSHKLRRLSLARGGVHALGRVGDVVRFVSRISSAKASTAPHLQRVLSACVRYYCYYY